MKDSPLISVITVVRNGGPAMHRALASVTEQTFDDFEHVIVDGASTDGTAELVLKLKASGAVRGDGFVASERDDGIYSAMNKAIGNARGEYLYFLNSDDYFFDAKTLERVAKELRRTKPPLLQTQLLLFNHENGQHGCTPTLPISYYTPLFRGVYQQEIWARADLYREHGKFNETFRLCADMDWLMRVLKRGIPCTRVSMLTTVFSTGGASSNFAKVAYEHRLAERANYSKPLWLACKVWRRTLGRIFG